MDRGAARSRKRSQLTERAVQVEAGPSTFRQHNTKSEGKVHPNRRPGLTDDKPKGRLQKERKPLIDEATRYKPKAIRSSAALIWSEAPFAIPPPKDVLDGVTRVDLSGSGVKDVSWLKECGVTWLSLAGCEGVQGWEAVGSLTELSVLNISNCGLRELPTELSGLANLKAIVAMGNEWTSLDEGVIGSWKELNSFIVSHSPNLSALPRALAQLPHLSKLTFSHCPSLTGASLPDLSILPLLRDVKMNNLPLLTSLPAHIGTWGTGDLSLTRKPREGESEPIGESSTRKGDGLEVLDLGNCSLPFSAIEPVFLKPKTKAVQWTHLRSLSLHSNPLGTTHSNYSELLQASASLPNLQIIDAKRVKERKRKGEVSETRKEKAARERREKKMKPSGANVGGTTAMRKWGTAEEADDVDASGVIQEDTNAKTSEGKKDRKRKEREEGRGEDAESVEKREKVKKVKTQLSSDPDGKRAEKSERKRKTAEVTSAQSKTADQPPKPVDLHLDPSSSGSAIPQTANRPVTKEPVFEVIDMTKPTGAKGEKLSRLERRVKERKEKAKKLPKKEVVDLKSMFGSKDNEGEGEGGLGLGVGGW